MRLIFPRMSKLYVRLSLTWSCLLIVYLKQQQRRVCIKLCIFRACN